MEDFYVGVCPIILSFRWKHINQLMDYKPRLNAQAADIVPFCSFSESKCSWGCRVHHSACLRILEGCSKYDLQPHTPFCWWPCLRSSRWQWTLGTCSLECEALRDESQVGKAPRTTAPEHLLPLHGCHCHFFSGIWNGVNEYGEIPSSINVVWLYHGNILF